MGTLNPTCYQMITKIDGIIRPEGGQGFARENYKKAIGPAIIKEFSALQNCWNHGTINVDFLDPPLRKSFANYWTTRIRWEAVVGDLGIRHEKFGLIKIRFECPPAGQYDAWIVMPEGHGYSYNENGGVEIVSETCIPEVRRGAACAIYIDHKPTEPRPGDFGGISIEIDGNKREIIPVHERRLLENPTAVPR